MLLSAGLSLREVGGTIGGVVTPRSGWYYQRGCHSGKWMLLTTGLLRKNKQA